MSEKRNVPTFQVYLFEEPDSLDGPVVSPNRQELAENLSELHELLDEYKALLVYCKQWIYVPRWSIRKVTKGKDRFQLPWPLTEGQ